MNMAEYMEPSAQWERHPDKDIREVVEYAKAKGWYLKMGPGHWGELVCCLSYRGEASCSLDVAGTPRNPTGAARRLRRDIDNCPHRDKGDE